LREQSIALSPSALSVILIASSSWRWIPRFCVKNFITALECLPWKKKKYRGPCECKRIPRRIRRLPINYCPPIVYLRPFASALFSLCEIYIREKTFLAGVLDSRDISISTYRRVVDYRQHPVPDCRVYR